MKKDNKHEKLKFWCQIVVPLVFDDGLSYYETISRITDYLNNVIQDVKAVENNVNSVVECFEQLQNYVNEYFDNLDVQNIVKELIDSAIRSGINSEYILYDESNVESALDELTISVNELSDNKQDKLTAGDGITISEDGVISATSLGSSIKQYAVHNIIESHTNVSAEGRVNT